MPSLPRSDVERTTVDRATVLDQTERIARSPVFRASRRLSATLRLIVEETLAGGRPPLKERDIAVRALGRPDSFDPRMDPAARVQVGRLRTALDRYYEQLGAADPIRICVPKGAYRAVFVPAGHDGGVPKAPPHGVGPAVAVHHFEDLGTPAALPHLPVSVADAVASELAHFPGCRVLGPSGPGAPWPPHRAPDFVVQGSIRSSSRAIRVTVRLVEASNDLTCWAWEGDVPIEVSALDVDDVVADAVGAPLADFRGAVHRRWRARESLDAVNSAVARFVAWLDDLEPMHAARVVSSLEDGLGLEPWSADLLAMLAEAERLRAVARVEPTPQRCEPLARRALALDPGGTLARLVLAACDVESGDHRNALAGIEAALGRSPHHPTFLVTGGWLLARLGSWARGVELVRAGTARNPSHPGWHRFLPAMEAARRGDHEAALGEARHIHTPGWLLGPLARATALAGLGRGEGARAELELVRGAVPGWDEHRGALLARVGLPDDLAGQVSAALDALER